MIPAGYNAKVIERPENWLGNNEVKEILSVSECISTSPIDHTSLWLCNTWLLYDSEGKLHEALNMTNDLPTRLRYFFYELTMAGCSDSIH